MRSHQTQEIELYANNSIYSSVESELEVEQRFVANRPRPCRHCNPLWFKCESGILNRTVWPFNILKDLQMSSRNRPRGFARRLCQRLAHRRGLLPMYQLGRFNYCLIARQFQHMFSLNICSKFERLSRLPWLQERCCSTIDQAVAI